MDFGFRISDFGWIAVGLLVVAPVFGGGESKLTRDAGFWVQTITGSGRGMPGGGWRIPPRAPLTPRAGGCSERGGGGGRVRRGVRGGAGGFSLGGGPDSVGGHWGGVVLRTGGGGDPRG